MIPCTAVLTGTVLVRPLGSEGCPARGSLALVPVPAHSSGLPQLAGARPLPNAAALAPRRWGEPLRGSLRGAKLSVRNGRSPQEVALGEAEGWPARTPRGHGAWLPGRHREGAGRGGAAEGMR